jgi:AcrR family transcriptional regulator
VTRPSRNIDELLLQAGRELLPEMGCAGLSIRRVAEHAGANLGMFHYHFKTRENFIRTLLQRLYDDMFSRLSLEVERHRAPRDALYAALEVLARFARDNRRLLTRIAADALGGEVLAAEFLHTNLPRHIGVLKELIRAGQAQAAFRSIPLTQAVVFLFGSVAAPILVGGALASRDLAPRPLARAFESDVLSDEAIDQRIEMALLGLAATVRRETRTPPAKRRAVHRDLPRPRS